MSNFYAGKKKHQDPDKNPFYERCDCKIFVGGIPLDVTVQEFRDYVAKWGFNIIKTYYKATEGQQFAWAMVEFATNRERKNLLLEHEKQKKRCNNKVLDIKPFEKPRKEADVSYMTSIGAPVRTTMTTTLGATARVTLPVGHITTTKAEVDLPSKNLQIGNAVTAVIQCYLDGTDFGILKTTSIGQGLFHIDAVTYCTEHKLFCKEVDCKHYKRYNETENGKRVEDQLPAGTQVNCIYRVLSHDEGEHNLRFQARLMWPHNSKKPSRVLEETESVLNDHFLNYMTKEKSKRKPMIQPLVNNNKSSTPVRSSASSPLPPFSPQQQRGAVLGNINPNVGLIRPPEPRIPTPALGPITSTTMKALDDDQMPNLLMGKDVLGLDVLLKKVQYLLNFFQGSCYMENVDRNILINFCRLILCTATGVENEQRAVLELIRFYELNLDHISQRQQDIGVANFKVLYPTLCNRQFLPALSQSNASSISGSLSDIAGALRGNGFMDQINAPNLYMPPPINNPPPTHLPTPINAPTVSEIEARNAAPFSTSSPTETSDEAPDIQQDVPDNWSDAASLSGENAIADAMDSLSQGLTTTRERTPQRDLLNGQDNNDMLAGALKTFRGNFEGRMGKLESIVRDRAGEDIYKFHMNNVSKTVVLTWNKVVPKKTAEALMTDLNMFNDSPKGLLMQWRKEALESWKVFPNVDIAVDEIAGLTLTFVWEELNLPRAPTTLALFHAPSIVEAPTTGQDQWLLSGVRGIVIHYFDNSFGLVQTEHGLVLFEMEMVILTAEKDSPLFTTSLSWDRCTDLAKYLPVGSMVRLNARSTMRSGSKQEYLYATKVYTATWNFEEPFSGVVIPGGFNYWGDVKSSFGKLVYENSRKLVLNRMDGAYGQAGEYGKAYSAALSSVLAEKKKKVVEDEAAVLKDKVRPRKKELNSFSTFQKYISRTHPATASKISIGINVLASTGVTLHALRKDYIAKKLLHCEELFNESVELLLMHCDKHLGATAAADLMDPSVFLAEFFSIGDAVTEGQVEEQRKMLGAGIKGVLQPIEKNLEPLREVVKNGVVGEEEEEEEEEDNDDEDEGNVASYSGASNAPATNGNSTPERRESTASNNQMMTDLSRVVTEQNTQIANIVSHLDIMAAKQAELNFNVNGLLTNNNSNGSDADNGWKNKMEQEMKGKKDEIDQLKREITEMKKRTSLGGAASNGKADRRQLVKLVDISGKNVFSFSTDDNGNLEANSVDAIFPGIRLLKTQRSPKEATTIVPNDKGWFKPPPDQNGLFLDYEYTAMVPPKAEAEPAVVTPPLMQLPPNMYGGVPPQMAAQQQRQMQAAAQAHQQAQMQALAQASAQANAQAAFNQFYR